jgi:hypothetical protein
MPKQRIPDIEFSSFVVAELPALFSSNKIEINEEYQRGDIWKHNQRIELIKSMLNSYSIGVLVLFMNEKGAYEILDGQQRIITIRKYIENTLDLSESDLKKYSELTTSEKALFDAYSVYYLRLKSFDPDTREEDITQTFLRLQEGTPLNKAEKINAFRGEFKNLFRKTRETNNLFKLMGKDKRFRFRLLAAEFLLLELETDFDSMSFPELTLQKFREVIGKYSKKISIKKETFYVGNLEFLHSSLNLILTAMEPRDIISFYLLISYLRKSKADNSNVMTEFSAFAEEFLENLNSFSIYDTKPPKGCMLNKELFRKYLQYKNDARQATSSDSLKSRFKFILQEYERTNPFILKDKKRLHDIEEKRTLFFRQRGLCSYCKKPLDFRQDISAHHELAHSRGGITSDLSKAKLLHDKCHKRLEKELKNKARKQV